MSFGDDAPDPVAQDRVYEKELLHSRTELEYVQSRSGRIFYLNCISVIHGMAEMHHAEDIPGDIRDASDYSSGTDQ